MRAFGEHQLLALLRGVGLDDPNAAKRLGKPAGHLGVDLAPFAEQRSKAFERRGHTAAKRAENHERDQRESPVQIHQDTERNDGRQNRAGQLNQSGPDQVSDAFRVGHDPRDQDAGLRAVEVPDRQSQHVRFDFLPELGDRSLGGNAQHLRIEKRRRRSHNRCGTGRQSKGRKKVPILLADDVVHEVLGRRGEHEIRQAADDHQEQTECQTPAMRPDERSCFLPGADITYCLYNNAIIDHKRAKF